MAEGDEWDDASTVGFLTETRPFREVLLLLPGLLVFVFHVLVTHLVAEFPGRALVKLLP